MRLSLFTLIVMISIANNDLYAAAIEYSAKDSTKLSTKEQTNYRVKGLEGDAEILIDQWGIPHIYAEHHYDAFFVQGFNAARDRLWQIDLWRRRGLGELSEVLGSNFVEQDKAARLFLYRRSMFREWLAYGSDAKAIATAFTNGINAYVKLIQTDIVPLPPEFELLDYKPADWSPEDVVRIRSNGLWRNVINEVHRANVICNHSIDTDAKRRKLEPEWQLKIPEGLDPCEIPYETVKLYALAQAPVDFSRANHFARGGSADTPNSTRYRQDFSVASGASWRMVVEVGNWDSAVMTNAPGQSGDPTSPHYDDMLQVWADEGHMPLLYSREKIEANTEHVIFLKAE